MSKGHTSPLQLLCEVNYTRFLQNVRSVLYHSGSARCLTDSYGLVCWLQYILWICDKFAYRAACGNPRGYPGLSAHRHINTEVTWSGCRVDNTPLMICSHFILYVHSSVPMKHKYNYPFYCPVYALLIRLATSLAVASRFRTKGADFWWLRKK